MEAVWAEGMEVECTVTIPMKTNRKDWQVSVCPAREDGGPNKPKVLSTWRPGELQRALAHLQLVPVWMPNDTHATETTNVMVTKHDVEGNFYNEVKLFLDMQYNGKSQRRALHMQFIDKVRSEVENDQEITALIKRVGENFDQIERDQALITILRESKTKRLEQERDQFLFVADDNEVEYRGI
jgi:hypothetical protein